MSEITQPVIYRITNRKDGKVYIGCSANGVARFRSHKQALARGNHQNVHLQRAYTRDGADSFSYRIIEVVPSLDVILEREAYWIAKHRATEMEFGYNKCAYGGYRGGIPHTEEGKARISAANKGRPKSAEHRAKIGVANKGKVRKRSMRAAYREARKGLYDRRPELRERSAVGGRKTGGQNKGAHWSDEQRARASRSAKRRVGTVEGHARMVKASLAAVLVNKTDKKRAARVLKMKAFWADPVRRAKMIEARAKARAERG